MLTLDGSKGEGGGQILRSALSLSVLTGTPFRIESIRARRSRPGLLAQHLAAVRAAQQVCSAELEGAVAGSRELVFRPGPLEAGDYCFDIGTAGSTTLVLQTVLPALVLAKRPSTVRVKGGTHNPSAPVFEFLERAFVPIVNRQGPKVKVQLEQWGFYPAGGGGLRAQIEPAAELAPLEITERGEVQAKEGLAIVSALPERIAVRELNTLYRELGWPWGCLRTEVVREPAGPGNAVVAVVASSHVTEVFSAVGERGVRAERVAGMVAAQVRDYLQAAVPIGPHLADQLILPLAIARKGLFRTLQPTLHARTLKEVVEDFLGVAVRFEQESEQVWCCRVG